MQKICAASNPSLVAHRFGELPVAGADLEDGKLETMQKPVSLLRPGHQPEVLAGKIPDQGIAEAVGLEKRQDELQGVAGLVFRLLGHIRQVVAITAHLGKEAVAVRFDKLPAELEGIVIEGQRPFAVRI